MANIPCSVLIIPKTAVQQMFSKNSPRNSRIAMLRVLPQHENDQKPSPRCMVLWPRMANCWLSDAVTRPKPPELDHGNSSLETMTWAWKWAESDFGVLFLGGEEYLFHIWPACWSTCFRLENVVPLEEGKWRKKWLPSYILGSAMGPNPGNLPAKNGFLGEDSSCP